MTQEDVWNQFWTSKAPANVNKTLAQTNTLETLKHKNVLD